MPVCPVCETPNADDAAECGACGKVLVADGELVVDVTPLAGLEVTLHDRRASGGDPGERVPGLEQTILVERDLPVLPESTPDLEPTQLEQQPDAPLFWTVGKVELDRGREDGIGERTPAPQDTGSCPWCGAAATGLVCDSCGRRRSRFAAPERAAAAVATNDETVLCPQCLSRVPHEARCIECHSPLPLREVF
jgi:hypothetical protein